MWLPSSPCNHYHHTSQHGLLLLCRTDEAADALNDLALRIHLLFPGLLAQEDSGHCKVSTKHASRDLGNGHPSPPTPRPICFLLAGAGEVICSSCFLALARRNFELLFICAVKSGARWAPKFLSGGVSGHLGAGLSPCLGHQSNG